MPTMLQLFSLKQNTEQQLDAANNQRMICDPAKAIGRTQQLE